MSRLCRRFVTGLVCALLLAAYPAQADTRDTASEQASSDGGAEQIAEFKRLQEQIQRMTSQQAQGPRRLFVGSRIKRPEVARYVQQIKQQIDDRCSRHIALGRPLRYGSAQLAISLHHSGTLQEVSVSRSSGSEALDRAFTGCVQASGPFPPFEPELRRDTDILVLVRYITFARVPVTGAREEGEPAASPAQASPP